MKGQVSVEYLIIVGIALGILIPGVFIFSKYAQSENTGEATQQLSQVGREMIASIRDTYALGINSWTTLDVVLPDNVQRIYVNPLDSEEVVIEYQSVGGISDAVFVSKNIPVHAEDAVDGNITRHPGLTKIKFTSEGLTVKIEEVTS